MNHRIVTESSAYMKQLAKGSLRGNWVNATVGMMIFYVLTVTVRNILNLLVDNSVTYTAYNGQVVNIVISGNLYDFFTTPIFSFGILAFLIVMVREGNIQFDRIFSGFEFYLKILLMTIVMGIKIILWTCLLVIPGIIAALNYSQSYYIFFDDPSKGVLQCIHESTAMMKGNKGSLFILALSFIGWLLLASLASNVMLLPVSILQIGNYFNQFYSIIGYIPLAVVIVYMNTAQVHFYQLLKPLSVEGTLEDANS